MRSAIWLMTVAVLAGCASLFSKFSEESAPKTVEPTPPPTKIAKREVGALWSESSAWNDLYAASSSRVMGDPIKIQISENFKRRMAPSPEKAAEPNKEGANDETKVVEAVIREVLPRKVYAISANQDIRIGGKQTRLHLTGNVRERDIAADETVSTDSIFNLTVEPQLPQVAAADAPKDGETSSEAKSPPSEPVKEETKEKKP